MKPMRPEHGRQVNSSWLFLFLLALCVETNVYAYLDPGSGSMVAQVLAAGFAGLVLSAKMFWKRITGRFRRKSKDPHTTPPA